MTPLAPMNSEPCPGHDCGAAIAEIRMRGRHAEPLVPVERGGHGVHALGPRVRIAPFLVAPRMHFPNGSDGAGADKLYCQAVLNGGMNLKTHLRDELPLTGIF